MDAASLRFRSLSGGGGDERGDEQGGGAWRAALPPRRNALLRRFRSHRNGSRRGRRGLWGSGRTLPAPGENGAGIFQRQPDGPADFGSGVLHDDPVTGHVSRDIALRVASRICKGCAVSRPRAEATRSARRGAFIARPRHSRRSAGRSAADQWRGCERRTQISRERELGSLFYQREQHRNDTFDAPHLVAAKRPFVSGG